MTNYRQIYNQSKSLLAQRHNEELHTIMVELGYVKNVKTTKEEVEDEEETLSPKEEKKEESKRKQAQKEIDKIITKQVETIINKKK